MEKVLEKDNIKRISSLDFFVLAIILIIIFDMEIFGIFGSIFFRDFSIIFEGGYRISSGQVPYQDFFIPMGPVVFYMQGFFNFIFGNNIISMAAHSFIIAAVLCILFYFILRKEFNYFMSIVFTLFFFVSFNGLTFYPFYNIAPYFFLFLNIFLILIYRKKDYFPKYLLFLSAILATLGFYSKHDVGLLHLVFILFYFSFNYPKQWKSIFIYYFLPSIGLIVGIYLLLSNLSGFQYWFDLGQPPHKSRLLVIFTARSIWCIVTSWKFYISIFLFFSYLYYFFIGKKNKEDKASALFRTNDSMRLVIIFLIISVTTLISQCTSGLTNNSFSMGDALLVFILFILIKENTDFLKYQGKVTIIFFLIVILTLTVNPFTVYGQLLLNYKNPSLGRIPAGCYSGVLLPQASLDGLEIIRNTIEKYGEPDFFSMTEYSFLYCDYKINPTKNMPLWFDENVTFFKENILDIIKEVNSSLPKVILVQDAHRNRIRNMATEFEERFTSLGYTRIAIVDAPASYQNTFYSLGLTKTDIIKIEKSIAPIIILVRNDLLKNSNKNI